MRTLKDLPALALMVVLIGAMLAGVYELVAWISDPFSGLVSAISFGVFFVWFVWRTL